MNDRITTALRELESAAPDPHTVEQAVYQAIQTRERRRRLAVTTAAVASVIALAAGAVAIGTNLADDAPPVLNQEKDQMVPVAPLATTFPVNPGKYAFGRLPRWELGPGMTAAHYLGGDKPDVSITAYERDDLELQDGPPTSQEPEETTVSGHAAKLFVHKKGTKRQRFEVRWMERPGLALSVESESRDFTLRVANGLLPRDSTVKPLITFGLAPRGFTQRNESNVCESNPHQYRCISVEKVPKWRWPIVDGPEPVDRRPGCPQLVTSGEKPLQVGAPRRIDGVTIRLASNGCAAVREHKDGSRILARTERGVQVTPMELARTLATAKIAE